MNNQETLLTFITIVSCFAFFLPTIKYRPNAIITIIACIFFSLFLFIFGKQDYMIYASLVIILINLIYICFVIYHHSERIYNKDITFRYDDFILVTFSIISLECFIFLNMAKSFEGSGFFSWLNLKMSYKNYLIIIFFLSIVLNITTYYNNLYLTKFMASG